MWAKAVLTLKLDESYFWDLTPCEFYLLEQYHDEQKMRELELSRNVSVSALIAVEEAKQTGRIRLQPLFKKVSAAPKKPIKDDILAIAEAIKRKRGDA